jgi:hypothetical protein
VRITVDAVVKLKAMKRSCGEKLPRQGRERMQGEDFRLARSESPDNARTGGWQNIPEKE